MPFLPRMFCRVLRGVLNPTVFPDYCEFGIGRHVVFSVPKMLRRGQGLFFYGVT